VKTAVVIDYHDACARAGEAFDVHGADAQFDPVRGAEILVTRSRVGASAVLERIVVHHALPERRFDRDGFRREQQRAERWRTTDPRVATELRSARLPRHAPDERPEAKAVATAIALDVSFLLERGECEHVIVLSHREDLLALSQILAARHAPELPGLEYASWRSKTFPIRVPETGPLGNILLLRHDFDACQERQRAGSGQ
jgi:hypothetical protein